MAGSTFKRDEDGKVLISSSFIALLLYKVLLPIYSFLSAHTDLFDKFSKPFPFSVNTEVQNYLLSFVGRDDTWLYDRSQLIEPKVSLRFCLFYDLQFFSSERPLITSLI